MHPGARPGEPLGFGAGICLRLGLVDEFRVYVTDIDRAAAERTAEEIRKDGASAKALTLDVTDEAQIKEAIELVAAESGRLDALCNNAGIFPIRPMEELTAEEFQRTVDINLFGPTFVSKHGIELMKKAGNGGVVTFVASDSGLKAAQVWRRGLHRDEGGGDQTGLADLSRIPEGTRHSRHSHLSRTR